MEAWTGPNLDLAGLVRRLGGAGRPRRRLSLTLDTVLWMFGGAWGEFGLQILP